MSYPFPEWAGIGKFVLYEDEQWRIIDRGTYFDSAHDRERGTVLLESTFWVDHYAQVDLSELGEDPGVQGIEA